MIKLGEGHRSGSGPRRNGILARWPALLAQAGQSLTHNNLALAGPSLEPDRQIVGGHPLAQERLQAARANGEGKAEEEAGAATRLATYFGSCVIIVRSRSLPLPSPYP